jgi:hypothetical protein
MTEPALPAPAFMSRASPPITMAIFMALGLMRIRTPTQSGPRSPPCSPVEGAEEFAIHDYEGFEGVSISEYAGIDSVARIAVFIAEHGKLGAPSRNGTRCRRRSKITKTLTAKAFLIRFSISSLGCPPLGCSARPHAAHTHPNQDRFAPVKPFPFLRRRLDREQIVETVEKEPR